MARKRKELPELKDIEIGGVAAEGNAIARLDGGSGIVCFIPFGAPGDIADVKLTRKRSSYAEGRITRLVHPSELRVAPRCSHFTICGGCRWQHLPYDFQLQCKQQQVTDALERIAKVELPEISPILGSREIWGYRNKMEYTMSNRAWLTFEQIESGEKVDDRNACGFHIPGAFDKVLDIKDCHLQEDFGNRLRLFVKQRAKERGYSFFDLRAQEGLLRTLMIRTASTGEKMAVVVFGQDEPAAINDMMTAIKEAFPEITSLMYVVNTKANDTIGDLPVKLFSGLPYIEEEMEGLRFRVGPKSFYQTNSRQAYELYKVARAFAGLTGGELVYDLYTGTGTIANFIARQARHVIGIEYVADAIEDAKVNSAVNGIDNTEFYAGDMKDVLTDTFISEHGGTPDVMVIDPPRAGMHQDVVDVILRARPTRLVYVSCNPATQARDIALLDVAYKVEAIQPVDMFPHTAHVENVCLLTLRQSGTTCAAASEEL
ncbi:MAG: 23S rRNA (uracil(1939)-C(5))-methyltransferase RlmD [Pseudoflavonifractor sp.]|nr:23S rRNA (uracil(1939)-C(5))-methyltransferase RlmD [Alloprevotella sp.]MCM1116755.1 23S rRNA (uracil(1939)-C(5))-methyltransferase RlmD [Pseudoflavonifractor sp.]